MRSQRPAGGAASVFPSDSPDRSLLSMRRRSESTQNSFPTSLSTARATGFPRPLKNSTSRSVPSSAARSIFGERSSRLVKYMYLQDNGEGHTARVILCRLFSSAEEPQQLQTSSVDHTMNPVRTKPAIMAPNNESPPPPQRVNNNNNRAE